MLIEFRVSNFLSFDEITTLSMVATKDKEHEKTNVFNLNDRDRLLKTAVIYGANGAGKSNLIRALTFMRSFILHSGYHSVRGAIPDHSFKLNVKSSGKPSFFEVVFLQDKKRFRYGFELGDNKVVSEWLFFTRTTKEVPLFTRYEGEITVGASFKEARGLEDGVRDRSLFLIQVAAANEEVELLDAIMKWFQTELMVTYGSALMHNLELTLHYIEEHDDENYKDKFITLLKKFDIFDDFDLDDTGTFNTNSYRSLDDEAASLFSSHEHPRIVVKRNVYDGKKLLGTKSFDLMRDESDGTKKLFAFAGAVIVTLEQGGVLVVDELELKLHPLITKTIIGLFNSEKNKKRAQLIFTTHDTNLLSNKFFRRDQIWFVEKNHRGSSSLYSLVEYKPRKDATFSKDYILGKYGAIPYIGNFDDLLGRDG